MKTRKIISVDVPFSWCEFCSNFKIEQHNDSMIANFEEHETSTTYTCANEKFCVRVENDKRQHSANFNNFGE